MYFSNGEEEGINLVHIECQSIPDMKRDIGQSTPLSLNRGCQTARYPLFSFFHRRIRSGKTICIYYPSSRSPS